MTIPYESLPFWKLLRISDAYDLIDEAGKAFIPEWDICKFERYIYYDRRIPYEFTDELALVLKNACKPLSDSKPMLRYSVDGKHFGFELFLDRFGAFPRDGQQLFIARLSRTLSNYVLPIDEQVIRDQIVSVGKEFYSINKRIIRLQYENGGIDDLGIISESIIREVRSRILEGNRAFQRRETTGVYPPPVFWDEASRRIRSHCEEIRFSHYHVKHDLSIDDVLCAVEPKSTRNQIDVTFFLWGVYTGEPLTYAEAARRLNKSNTAVRLCEQSIIRRIAIHPGTYDYNLLRAEEEA